MRWLVVILLSWFFSVQAEAQLRGRTTPVFTGNAPLTLPDDAEAVAVNPGALPFLESWSLVYRHAEAPSVAGFVEQGDALRFATPLLFDVALGASVESVRPSAGSGERARGVGSLGLGWAPSTALGIGAAVRFYQSSEDAELAGLTTLDLGATWRPAETVAFAFVARDVTGPLFAAPTSAGGTASFLLSAALRPTGTRVFTLDVGGALETDGTVGVRGAFDLAIPYTGRLVASAEVRDLDRGDPSLLVSAGLLVHWGQLGVGGGGLYGDGFEQRPGWYAEARLEGADRPGLPTGGYVLDLPVRSGVGARGLIALSLRLEQALHDDDVRGVYVRLRDSGLGSAYAEELRHLFMRLRDAGKPVVCHLSDGSGGEFYACAAATATYVDVAGGIRLTGPSGTTMMFGGILHDWGIRTDLLRIGPYKSAAEQFTVAESSQPARDERARLYEDVHERLVADLSRDFERPQDEIARLIDEGPYQTLEAVEARLIDGAADEHGMREVLAEVFDGHPSLRSSPPTRVGARWRQRYVGVVVVDGDIVDGDNLDIPIIGITQSGGRTVVEAIDGLAADPWCSAIVLRVDSPGGSALASDQIWSAVARARERKHVIASMGASAASGGYYVAAAAEEIWASPATLTGSIGVYFGKVDFAPIAERFNLGLEHYGVGRHAGMTSLYRPFTPDERRVLADKMRIWYRLFLQRVAQGRGMPVEAVDRVARGRIWSGDAAQRLGLVDRLGGFASALARARQLGEVGPEAPVIVVPWRPSSLLDYVVGPLFAGARSSTPVTGFESIDAGAVGALTPELFEALSFVLGGVASSDAIPQARLDSHGPLP